MKNSIITADSTRSFCSESGRVETSRCYLIFNLTDAFQPDLCQELAIKLNNYLHHPGFLSDSFSSNFDLRVVQSICNYYLYYDFDAQVGYYYLICHL
jgi:hypothetical protein